MKNIILRLQVVVLACQLLTACQSQQSGSYDGGYEQVDSSTQNYYDKGLLDPDYVDSLTNSVAGVGESSDTWTESTSSTDDVTVPQFEDDPSTEIEENTAPEENVEDTEKSQDNIKLVEEKLVYKSDMRIETKNYDEDKANILKMISDYGGIVQSTEEYDDNSQWYYEDNVKRYGTKRIDIQARIPSDKYHEFVGSVGTIGKVRSNSQNVDNISQSYYDTTADIQQLKIQEQRLLTMMQQATTIDDMIRVEQRLTEVQGRLSKLQTQLVYMDMDVAYSYVDIELKEVMEYNYEDAKEGFFKRLGDEIVNGFKAMIAIFEGLILFIVGFIPRQIPFIIAGLLLYKLYKWYRRKHPRTKKQRVRREPYSPYNAYGPMNNGMGPNGMGPNGMGPNGMGPNGMGPIDASMNPNMNGTGPNDTNVGPVGDEPIKPESLEDRIRYDNTQE